ncbi:MAG: aspartate/glutamate racemase family protein [Steroidobacterales bacterium]
MRIIGLLGGMSWESTATYYRLLNLAVKQRLGGLHSARIILYSVDFDEVERLQRAADWDTAGALLAGAATALQAAGAECILIGANTMHKVAPAVEAAVRIPVLHVVDATAAPIRTAGMSVVGLLGTRFVMEQDFYIDRLHDRHALRVLTPGRADRDIIHRIIFEELVVGKLLQASRGEFRRIMAALVAEGAQGVILGCTEFSLLVQAEDCAVPLFDSTSLHARMATDWSLS